MKKIKVFIKQISILILTVFITSIASDFSYAVANKSYSKKFHITKNKGKILESFTPTSVSGLQSPVSSLTDHIYIIQDLHCDKTVQKNIKSILQDIEKQEGRIDLVGCEGSFSKIDLSMFYIMKQSIRKKVTKRLQDLGYITGAELYAIEKGKKIPQK